MPKKTASYPVFIGLEDARGEKNIVKYKITVYVEYTDKYEEAILAAETAAKEEQEAIEKEKAEKKATEKLEAEKEEAVKAEKEK